MGSERRCVYVTRAWGIHDERWTAALRSSGLTVTDLSIERDELSIAAIRNDLMDSTDPVLAGPIDITQGLIGIHVPLFGLSWGFDLVKAHERNDDLTWMTDLSGLIVDSSNTRRIALESGIATDRVHTIPWGVDLGTFTTDGPAVDLSAFGVPATSKIIVSLRALEPVYHVEDIVRGFAHLAEEIPDAHLVIGNDGSLRAHLESLVQSLRIQDRVTFIGSLPEESLPGLLRAAEVYVTASEVDGSSVTLLQAMACGTAVVASDTPGNSEWITPGVCGLLFRVADPVDLAATLGRLLTSPRPESAHRFVSEARELVEERADWGQNSTQLAQILLKPT
jgi:glycosyltransferase involved in cell wall biosynthesis